MIPDPDACPCGRRYAVCELCGADHCPWCGPGRAGCPGCDDVEWGRM